MCDVMWLKGIHHLWMFMFGFRVVADINGAALTAASLQTVDGSANTAGLLVSTAGATQGISITGSALGVNNILGGNGGDVITGGAGVDTISGGTGSDTIVAGTGIDTITFTNEIANSDTITGGAGSDVFIMATTTAATVTAHIIKDIDLGTTSTAADTIQVSLTALEGLTTVANLSDTSSNDAANGDGTVVHLTADAQTVANADLVVIDTATYATEALMLAGLKGAGDSTITYGASLANNDGFLIAYSDGTHSYIAMVAASGADATSQGIDSVENIITLTGVNAAGLLNLDSSDFSIIA